MTNQTFYGTEQSSTISYLEFGEIDLAKGNKKVWDFRLHQKAYDWLMLGRYANDLMAYTEMDKLLEQESIESAFELYNTEIHHPNDSATNFDKFVALSLLQKTNKDVSFFELGQTIFGCIEGIVFLQNLLAKLNIPFEPLDLKSITWRGVDISQLFNLLSTRLHQPLKIQTSIDLDNKLHDSDIFYSKGITLLYAVEEINHIFELMQNSKIAIFDYSLTMGTPETTTIGSGKKITYLNFNDFIHKYQQGSKKLFVKDKTSTLNKDNNRIWLDCLYAPEDICHDYIAKHNETKENLLDPLKAFPTADRFTENIRQNNWISIETFLQDLP